jgi:hypothetical protein
MMRLSQARRVAEVVSYHNRRIKALEVQNKDRVVIEAAFGFHYQWNCLHGWLCPHLLLRRRYLQMSNVIVKSASSIQMHIQQIER